MNPWILGRQYDLTNSNDCKDLMDKIDHAGQNDARQICYALLQVVINNRPAKKEG